MLLCLPAGICDFFGDPDDTQNSTNNAFIEAWFFRARDDRTPIQGVIMYVESDPDAERPYNGPDQTFVSNQNGFVRAEVFPGLDLEQGTPGAPPTPFDVPPFLFFGDACVHFFHDGDFTTFSCGVTLGAGQVINLGTFFVTDFSGSGGVGGEGE